MDNRRDFLKKAGLLAGGTGMFYQLPAAIQKALSIDPAPGSTFYDAEHIVLLMQENRSFDHTYGTLQGVRGFNDPRAISLPNKNKVWLQSNKAGDTYAPFRLNIKDTKATWMSSLPHGWSNQVDARNDGKYDQWLESKRSGHKEYSDMPLTLGYYTRDDIPFYYALADAFTVCDQHFCSSLTGTTPNRLYFWTGTIREREDEAALARVWNEDADYDHMVSWKTFPERLEENGISWKVYQNEVSVGVGFNEEEDAWLANFGDNPLEYFTQYNVKLSPGYITNMGKTIDALLGEKEKRNTKLQSGQLSNEETKQLRGEIEWIENRINAIKKDQQIYTKEKYDQLSQKEKDLHNKAFSTSRNDPNYHQLETLKYNDNGTEREVKVPKGDILHQFREDVKTGKLPTVSWIVAPEKFSDHPSSAWYGAWYLSEVIDILTQNPEVWKKTIFILTYDENDGYFDHVPPFVAPHPHKPGTGAVSAGINTAMDFVSNADQQTNKQQARESSIGLGYRVPMVIASPWSRGGWVNSQVFDLTSPLQFLEKFLTNKTKKKIEETQISAWRRCVCGDLTSVFRPYNGEKITVPTPLRRNEFVESIHKAQFKKEPSNFKKLTVEEIAQINVDPYNSPWMAKQEKGIRTSCALPYEFYVDSINLPGQSKFILSFTAANFHFGEMSAGAPFTVYAPGLYRKESGRSWNYAVLPGNIISDNWDIADFENNQYHLLVYGPNGFYREFLGNDSDPLLTTIVFDPEMKKSISDKIYIQLVATKQVEEVFITDNAYKTGTQKQVVGDPSSPKTPYLIFDIARSFGWYDFTITVKGNPTFKRRYAGHVETGQASKTDPFMGQVI